MENDRHPRFSAMACNRTVGRDSFRAFIISEYNERKANIYTEKIIIKNLIFHYFIINK